MHTKTIEENHINRTAPHEPTNERTHEKANQQEKEKPRTLAGETKEMVKSER